MSVTNLLKTPNADIAPGMSVDEGVRRILWIVNQLNNSSAIYNANPSVRTEGQSGSFQTDSNGDLLVSLGTKIAGEDLTDDVMKVESQMTYNNISTATTTTIKSGSGFFHALIINKHVATGVITIYDSTTATGTKIATITAGATVLTDPPITAIYDLKFTNGLTIVTSAAENLTVLYR